MELKYEKSMMGLFPKCIELKIVLDTLPILDPDLFSKDDHFYLKPGEDGYRELWHLSAKFNDSRLICELGDLTTVTQRELHSYIYHRAKLVVWVEELI